MTEDEKVLIVPLGAESKKISQAISNDTSRQILDLLADQPLASSQIADQLDLPITTVQYNMDRLLEAGLIKVERTRWSEKGREMKVYGPIRKLIVVVPQALEDVNIGDILKKYLVAGIAATAVAVALEWFTRSEPMMMARQGKSMMDDMLIEEAPMAAPLAAETASQAAHLGLWFLAGCVFILLVLAGYEAYLVMKKSSQ